MAFFSRHSDKFSGKRDDGDDDDDDEDEQQHHSTQTIALISVFTIVGIICLAVSSMAAFHYWRKRALLKDGRCLEEEGTAQQGAQKKNLDDNYEPRCAWCYIAENKLCTWCAGEKSDPDNESAGTTIYSNRVSEEREMGATTPQIPAKASFRPDVGVYTIPSPPASFKGKGRAMDESGAPSPTIERT